MGIAVTTVASGGLPVKDLGGPGGIAVTEVASYGLAVTKVTGTGSGMGVSFVSATGGAAIVATTFNLATVTNTTLSNGNLTATHANATAGGARATPTVSSGKFYFEIKLLVGTGSQDAMGILPAASSYLNLTTEGVCTARSNGNITAVSVASGKTVGAFASNDVMGCAVDFTSRLIWFRRNAGNWNGDVAANPATGTGGVSFPATTAHAPAVTFVGAGTAAGNAYTANFGASAFSGAVPSGFTAGWPA